MKQVLKHIGIYALMVILFTTSTGFTLFSHFCFMDGNQEVSASKIDSCCANQEHKAVTELTSNCCSDETNFIKFDFQAFAQRNIIVDEMPPVVDLPLLAIDVNIELDVPQHLAGLSPPKTGRERLADIHLLRI